MVLYCIYQLIVIAHLISLLLILRMKSEYRQIRRIIYSSVIIVTMQYK